MDSINGLRAFDWDGPVLSEPRSFVVRPSSAGGFEACAVELEEKAKHALLERIAELAPNVKVEGHGKTVEALAEAYAWLERPDQSHGGGSTTVKSG